MIAIIDYGLGNINAFANVYKKLDIPAFVAKNPEDLKKASKIILPGVGAFDYAMTKFNSSGMLQIVNELVIEKKMPILGICVGMQIMADSSEEGVLPGLGYIKGTVRKFAPEIISKFTPLPHMGWNEVIPEIKSPLFKNIETNPEFYFLHSYYFSCEKNEDIIATTDYAGKFACVVNYNNIYGVQFHPEKSHNYGMQLLENFSTI
jgi:glutamine amidotransferase